MIRNSKAAIFFCVTLLAATSAHASRFVETVGNALIPNGATQLAREKAIQNAVEQAMLQTEARVDSTATISNNVLTIESSRVNAAGTVEDVQVLEEWTQNDVYYVRIRAHVPEDKARAPSPAARYRKKVAVLQFEIQNRAYVYDMPGIENEMPRELVRRLNNSGNFIGIDGTQYLVNVTLPLSKPITPATIIRLADALGSQIIVTGVIRDMSVQKHFLSKARELEVEIMVFDGISGTRLSQHRFSEAVDGADYFEHAVTLFSQNGFATTPYGAAVDRVMNRQVELISNDLEQVPFSARIVKIDGKKIFFDAGFASQVRVGDVLMTYKVDPSPVLANNKSWLGYQEDAVASLSVHNVQPNFSIGETETKVSGLFPGDIIRFGW